MRENWRQRASRRKRQRANARMFTIQKIRPDQAQGDIVITLTRIAPRKLDSDNLAGAMKAIRDGIADAIERDDGEENIDWQYAQRNGEPKQYGVVCEIRRAE